MLERPDACAYDGRFLCQLCALDDELAAGLARLHDLVCFGDLFEGEDPRRPGDVVAGLDLAAAGAPASPVPETRKGLVLAREAIRDVVSGQGGAAALDQLNAVLSHGHLRLSIGPPMNPRQTLEVDDPAWRPAVMAAANLLELLAQAPDRIRRCQNPGCVLWFFDTTRNGTRRWCSMEVCGNRAKARRHYDRARKPAAR